MSVKKKRFPLGLKAFIIIAAASVLLSATAAVMSKMTFSGTNEALFKDRAKDVSFTASLSINGDDLKKVADEVLKTYRNLSDEETVTSDDWGTPEFDAYLGNYSYITGLPEYERVYDSLSKIQNGGIKELSSIYTLIYDESRGEPLAIYLVDAAEEDPCLPGVIDTFNPEDDLEPVHDPSKGIRAYITKTEQYGCLVVSGTPVYTSGGDFAAFVVADLSMNEIKEHETGFVISLVILLSVMTVVICAVFFLAVNIAVIHPINMLSAAAVSYVSDPENKTHFATVAIERNDEIGELSEAMKKMEKDLNDHIAYITKMTSEKERITAELNVATKIQRDMCPTNFPKRDDLSMFALMAPAKEVGGDFYDFFFTDDDHIALIMADVSGKGVPAALFMVIAKSIIRNIFMIGGTVSEMSGVVNRILCDNDKMGFFVTAWIGLLTLSTGEISYVNAGHEYPALKHKNGDFELIVTENCPPLAVDEDTVFTEETMKLGDGDVLYLYTDGVTEAKNGDGRRYGTDRMISTLDKNSGGDIHSLLDSVIGSLDDFIGSAETFDDITMMGVRYNRPRSADNAQNA